MYTCILVEPYLSIIFHRPPCHSPCLPLDSTRLVDLDVSVNLVHEHGGAPNPDGPADEEQRHAEEQHVSKVERHLQ